MQHSVFAVITAVLASFPALALDCTRASTAVETAICANSALKAADDAMAGAYRSARASMASDQQQALAQSQRKWIEARENRCAQETPALRDGCIAGETVERTRLLEGGALSGPGPDGRIIPYLIQQDPSPTAYEIDYVLLRFAEPATAGQRFFNEQIDEIAARAPLGAEVEVAGPEGVFLTASETLTLSFASPRFISVAASGYSYEGGAHGLGGEYGLNVDMEKAAVLDMATMFPDEARASLQGECRDMIAAEKKARFDDQTHDLDTDMLYSDEAVAQALADPESWIFDAAGARVVFNAYEIGAYAEGAYECRFAAERLRDLAGGRLPTD